MEMKGNGKRSWNSKAGRARCPHRAEGEWIEPLSETLPETLSQAANDADSVDKVSDKGRQNAGLVSALRTLRTGLTLPGCVEVYRRGSGFSMGTAVAIELKAGVLCSAGSLGSGPRCSPRFINALARVIKVPPATRLKASCSLPY